jgi:hypothetical protein
MSKEISDLCYKITSVAGQEVTFNYINTFYKEYIAKHGNATSFVMRRGSLDVYAQKEQEALRDYLKRALQFEIKNYTLDDQ